jgi:hypothetical protein
MPQLPQPGQLVCWRNPRHAHALGWTNAYGPGPFVAVGTVDKSHQGIPAAVIVETKLGEKEVNQVWLELAGGRAGEGGLPGPWEGYCPSVLLAIDG